MVAFAARFCTFALSSSVQATKAGKANVAAMIENIFKFFIFNDF